MPVTLKLFVTMSVEMVAKTGESSGKLQAMKPP